MKRTFTLLACACLLLLTGCLATYPVTYTLPKPLRLSGASYQSTTDSQLAVAVDASGRKHTTHIECPTDPENKECRLIYEATKVGEVDTVTYRAVLPSSGYTFRNPDVAVTDSGLAFVTYQSCPTSDSGTSSRQCITLFLRSDYSLGSYVLEPGSHSLAAPVLASRGEVVYAVHEVTVGTASSALRYCKISAPGYTCFWASDHSDTGLPRSDAAAAVSGSGSLHVVWLYGLGTIRTAYTNNNYASQNADMAVQLNMGTAYYFAPTIAVETDDGYVYYALATNELTSDRMSVFYCATDNCAANGGVEVVNLPEEKQWTINGKFSIAAGSSYALVGFPATTTDTPQQSEIYWFTYPAAGTPGTVTAPYPTNLENGSIDCDPVVALVDGWNTVGWHICGFPPGRDDVYYYGTNVGGHMIHASNWAGRGGLDMAANGKWVAGIWNELQSDGRVATWLTFNSHISSLPMIKK